MGRIRWIFVPAAGGPPPEPVVAQGQYWRFGKPFMKVRQNGITLADLQVGTYWRNGKPYAVNGT